MAIIEWDDDAAAAAGDDVAVTVAVADASFTVMDKEEEVIGLRLVSIALSREADFDNDEEHFCVDKGEVKKEDDRSEVDQLVTLELAGRFNSNLFEFDSWHWTNVILVVIVIILIVIYFSLCSLFKFLHLT